MNDNPADDATPSEAPRKAGLFDIRFIIGGLLSLYGAILIVLGIFNASDEELARGDGLNINLYGGLGMLAVGIAFGVWARLRPVVVREPAPDAAPDVGQ